MTPAWGSMGKTEFSCFGAGAFGSTKHLRKQEAHPARPIQHRHSLLNPLSLYFTNNNTVTGRDRVWCVRSNSATGITNRARDRPVRYRAAAEISAQRRAREAPAVVDTNLACARNGGPFVYRQLPHKNLPERSRVLYTSTHISKGCHCPGNCEKRTGGTATPNKHRDAMMSTEQ